MTVINKNEISDVNSENNFDILSQGFDEGRFYGLEYILEDFFQESIEKQVVPARDVVDWFGLNT